MKSKFSYTPEELEYNKVLKNQQEDIQGICESIDSESDTLIDRINESEKLLSSLGYDLAKIQNYKLSERDSTSVTINSWNVIVDNATTDKSEVIVLEDIFTEIEIAENSVYLEKLRKEFYDLNKLDKWDYAVAGISGTISALLDYFFVTKINPSNGNLESGLFKSGVEKLWDKILPPDVVSILEETYKVPFDISTNTSKISQEVLGLNPMTHRFQSLGHDPLLGFIFGIKDLMNGELTAIDGNGRWIVQLVNGAEPVGFLEAFIKEFGHLLSDINATSKTGMKLSVPAPFMPLLQIVQFGAFSYKDKTFTIGDLVKSMYKDGYNFNHFIGMSIPVLLNEIIIRLYTTLRSTFTDIYIKSSHKDDIMLFIANSILCAENIGKVVITENPFAINYTSWITTAKYTVKTLKYVVIDYKIEQLAYVQKLIDCETVDMYEKLAITWNDFCDGRPIIELI